MSCSAESAHPIKAFYWLTELHLWDVLNIWCPTIPCEHDQSRTAVVWLVCEAMTPASARQHDYSIFYFPNNNVWSRCTKEGPAFLTPRMFSH